MIHSILILDPSRHDLEPLREAFQVEVRPEDEVRRVPTLKELVGHLRDRSRYSMVVLSDSPGRRGSGVDLIARIHQADPEVPVILSADRGSVDRAAKAIAAGASDFLVTGERLRERIRTLLGKMRGLFEAIDRNRKRIVETPKCDEPGWKNRARTGAKRLCRDAPPLLDWRRFCN